MANIWNAGQTAVKIDLATNIAIDAAGPLDADFAAATTITGFMKNVTIVEPEGDIEKVDLLGVTSSFQNALLDHKPFGMAELTGTLVLDGDEMLVDSGATKQLFFGAPTAIAGGYSRYQAGAFTAGVLDRPQVAILVVLSDGTDKISFVLDDAYITKYGDVKIDGADGHWEVEVTIKCLPINFYMEWLD